jgi:hypothetical protein
MNRVINPDSTILQQVDGHWQKLAALILWKTVGRDKIVLITHADIEEFHRAFAPGTGVILTHGHAESIGFSLIDEAAAQRLAEHDSTIKGTA